MKTITFSIALLIMAALAFAQPKAIRGVKKGKETAVLFLPGFTSIQIAPASRHFIMFDQPDWLYEKVNVFLGNE